MSKKRIVNSMLGTPVDFDMFDVKAQLGNVPETETVKYRENLIKDRRKRKNTTKRKVKEMLAQQQINESAIRKALEKKNAADPRLQNEQVVAHEVDDSQTELENPDKINRKIKVKNAKD